MSARQNEVEILHNDRDLGRAGSAHVSGETRALATQVVDDVPVVNDLMAHVDGRAMSFKSAIDNLDRADHARTKAAGLSKDNTHIRANSDWRGFRMEPAIGFDQIRLICCKQN